MSKNKEAEEFNKLQKMGFTFDSSRNEYSEQPDSGGVIGGIRGVQEYGISGGIATAEIAESGDASEELAALETLRDVSPPSAEGSGVSEWTSVHGLNEESVVEKSEALLNTKTTFLRSNPK